MPSYLDFNTTKAFRNYILSKTLSTQDGPMNMTENDYLYKTQSDFSNVDPGAVDTNRVNDLSVGLYGNTYKPNTTQLFIIEELNDLPRRANLNFYADNSGNPYFTAQNHNLISIISNSNYQTESELFKFAANWIRDPNEKGPVYARIQQNLEAATIGRNRLIDALNGNTATAINLVTGREPLIEKNYKITVASTTLGKGLDFLQTVAGVEFPFSEIPGDYLSNPRNPVNIRPEAQTTAGRILQDTTGVLGSLIGIQRRPKLSNKPSDIMVEYMGQGQRQILYDLLSYSKYAPNYTTTARSQQSSKIFAFADNVAQGINRLAGLEAPRGLAYIGDDRGNDVKYTMSDFNDRQVKSSYYLSLLFDPIQATLFQRDKNIIEYGAISGTLTWTSKNSKNRLGENNNNFNTQRSQLEESLSTKYGFRRDSILGYTQEILNSLPNAGAESRAHVANAIDQTSRIFRDGDKLLSRGSAIQYVDKFGQESGVEYCRTWTKDRPYYTYSDTMKKGTNIRKYEGSVMTNPWNLNFAPMSNGSKGFDGSSNIFQGYQFGADNDGKSFYAKKYMFSIENLAWKTSTTAGFTVLDLPFCERGPNGGRVMWFPPYGLTINESNAATWESTNFLGRPEPIYTYQNTTRTGQLNFKIVVDHPSILNLLVREFFKDFSDDEADNYINAFFAGCEDLDFYSLIRRYSSLDTSDIKLIQDYLNTGKKTTEIRKFKTVLDPVVQKNEGESVDLNITQTDGGSTVKEFDFKLNFAHNIPTRTGKDTVSGDRYYNYAFTYYDNGKQTYIDGLETATENLLALGPVNAKSDYNNLFGSDTIPQGTNLEIVNSQKDKLEKYFDDFYQSFQDYNNSIFDLVKEISGRTVQTINLDLSSSTSSIGQKNKNRLLSLRRSYSVVKDFFTQISKDGVMPNLDEKWPKPEDLGNDSTVPVNFGAVYKLKDFGWDDNDGELQISTKNYGETKEDSGENALDKNCSNRDFINVKNLDVYSPISFYCRHVQASLKYSLKNKPSEPPAVTPPIVKTRIEEDGIQTIPVPSKKPPIDVMKRIIMKTLSECYYFKKLEDDSPTAFNSLKEKLKYFHPAFHSTTPEGLNSRMTFLQQCLRPGDTIPIKGVADDSDINARNTSFGPPPICVLRIGDFYHSKVVIKDVNFTFDDSVWDLNPEGIGVQPMIVNVSMQLNFIGGQGLERPIERLQNALSSNFYANTEVYDERAIATNKKIAGEEADTFTKAFLEELQNANAVPVQANEENKGNTLSEGTYIGELVVSSNEINHTLLVDNLKTTVDNYFTSYQPFYNKINKEYSPEVLNVVVSPTYRVINSYDIYNTQTTTPTSTISMFGLYKKNRDLSYYIKALKTKIVAELKSTSVSELLSIDKDLSSNLIPISDEILEPYLISLVESKLDNLVILETIKKFEETRDELIKTLDKLNFVVKYGKDAKLTSSDKGVEVTLSGFTSSDLYDKYEQFVEYVSENNNKLYADINTSIDYNDINLTTDILKNIMGVFLQEKTNEIINLYKQRDQILFNESIIKKLTKRIDNFIITPKDVNFKFKKAKNKKDDNQIKFTISTETNITDNAMLVELRKLKIDKFDVQNLNKLNYYKK
jgi:hypothetical protein